MVEVGDFLGELIPRYKKVVGVDLHGIPILVVNRDRVAVDGPVGVCVRRDRDISLDVVPGVGDPNDGGSLRLDKVVQGLEGISFDRFEGKMAVLLVASPDELTALTMLPAFQRPEVVLEIQEEDFGDSPGWDCLGKFNRCSLTAMWASGPPSSKSRLEARCLFDGLPKLDLVRELCSRSQRVEKALESAQLLEPFEDGVVDGVRYFSWPTGANRELLCEALDWREPLALPFAGCRKWG